MRVERIPTLSDNYTYLIIDEATNEAAVVDAPEAQPVVARVEALGVTLTKVLSTHHHWDHSAANPELAERYAAPVFGHASDASRIPGFTDGLKEGDRVSVGGLEAEIVFIPAHTKGHIAYVFPEAVFCGDTLFTAGCGRLFEGDPKMMHEALNLKLQRLPEDTLVYCGHEYTDVGLGERRAWTRTLLRIGGLWESGDELMREVVAFDSGLGGEADANAVAESAELVRMSSELQRRIRSLYGGVSGWVGGPTADQQPP